MLQIATSWQHATNNEAKTWANQKSASRYLIGVY
jgi:hypothetical protein